jgi:predicted thioesterase
MADPHGQPPSTYTWRGSSRLDASQHRTRRNTVETTRQYRVRECDLASNEYRSLGVSKWKPKVMTTAALGRLCELTAMLVLPGVTLGRRVVVDHKDSVIRGSVVTVTVRCTPHDDGWWECQGTVTADESVIAECELVFLANVDRNRYHQRRLAPRFAARSWATTSWLCILSGLSLLSVLAVPMQVDYISRHIWVSRIAEPALVIIWFMARKGLFVAIKDWFTLRRVSKKSIRATSIPLPRKPNNPDR